MAARKRTAVKKTAKQPSRLARVAHAVYTASPKTVVDGIRGIKLPFRIVRI